MKPPEQKPDALPAAERPSPAERALAPGASTQTEIRSSDSGDEMVRRLDNGLKGGGQGKPEEIWAGLKATYDPAYYAEVERDAAAKRRELEQLAEEGGRATADEAEAPPKTVARPPLIVSFGSPRSLIVWAVAVAVFVVALIVGGEKYGEYRAEQKAPVSIVTTPSVSVAVVPVAAPVPSVMVERAPVAVPSAAVASPKGPEPSEAPIAAPPNAPAATVSNEHSRTRPVGRPEPRQTTRAQSPDDHADPAPEIYK